MSLIDLFNNTKHKVLTQNLSGTYKQPFTGKFCIFFLLLGIANTALGIITLIKFTSLQSFSLPYNLGSSNISFTVPRSINKKLFFYLELSNFYQSHSFYSRSFSTAQLNGENTTKINSCKPLKFNDGLIIYPCGLIANTYVQDSYKLLSDTNNIPISTENISWSSVKEKVKNTQYTIDQIIAPPLWAPYKSVPMLEGDSRFGNWMGSATFPRFRKLYGVIENGLKEGNYRLIVNSTFPYGNKRIVLTESSPFGVRNYFLTVLMIITGITVFCCGFTLWKRAEDFTA